MQTDMTSVPRSKGTLEHKNIKNFIKLGRLEWAELSRKGCESIQDANLEEVVDEGSFEGGKMDDEC